MSNATKQSYYKSVENYSKVLWRLPSNPSRAWAFPVVTGHKYKLHWGQGLDWTNMQMDLSQMWTPRDLDTNI